MTTTQDFATSETSPTRAMLKPSGAAMLALLLLFLAARLTRKNGVTPQSTALTRLGTWGGLAVVFLLAVLWTAHGMVQAEADGAWRWMALVYGHEAPVLVVAETARVAAEAESTAQWLRWTMWGLFIL